MKLIVHVGVHKTGTSYIQKFLQQNYSELIEFGFIYPKEYCNWGSGHHDLALATTRKNISAVETGFINILKEASLSSSSNIVISSEAFSLVDDLTDFYKLATQFFSGVEFICFTRRQDELLESLYNQNVKSPATRYKFNVETFVEGFRFYSRYDFYSLYQKWMSLGDKINVKFVPFETKMDLCQLFLHKLGLEDGVLEKFKILDETLKLNSSIDNQLLPYLIYLNKRGVDDKEYQKYLRKARMLPNDRKTSVIDNELWDELSQYFNERNIKLNSKLGYLAVNEIGQRLEKKPLVDFDIEVDEATLNSVLCID